MTPEELLRITTNEWIAAADSEELEQVVRAIGALQKLNSLHSNDCMTELR